MKKKLKNIRWIMIIIATFLFFCGTGNCEVQAASKAKYSYKKVDKTKLYYNGTKYSTAKVYFKKAVLKGNSKRIKKINKAITKECNRFLNSESTKRLYEYTKTATYESNSYVEYYYYAESKVTYNKNGIISIKITTYWCAGGVGNVDTYGLTFNLKTGKQLYLTDVCNGTPNKIKQRVIKKIQNTPEQSSCYWDKINAYKTKNMNFYLVPNKKAIVCFGPYEINYGGWSRTFTIKSKYK